MGECGANRRCDNVESHRHIQRRHDCQGKASFLQCDSQSASLEESKCMADVWGQNEHCPSPNWGSLSVR